MQRNVLPLVYSAVFLIAAAGAGAGESRKPITQPKYDPAAPRVELFDGLDSKALHAELRPKNEFGGNVFIRNETDQPVTVVLPEAIVGVQVHPQFGPIGNGNGNNSGLANGPGQGAGPNQAVSGVVGQPSGVGNGPGIGNGPGQQGFFSIPAGATVRLPFESVCVEHGKAIPTPRNSYRLVRAEAFSDKPELKTICRAIAEGKTDRAALQAAAWHVASDMSWEELATKKFNRAAAADTPYFTPSQLRAARRLVAEAAQPGNPETLTSNRSTQSTSLQ